MKQLQNIISALTVRQRITIGIVAVAVIAGLWSFSRWSKERDMKALFTGLSAEDAGSVTGRLREAGVEYRVGEDGATILVPSAQVAELRLRMASEGLPKTGRIGFEIFDKTNFGATDFAEQVNFQRAIEGEMERSIMALAEVERARVHVTLAKQSVFLESRQPAKASVMVKLRRGAKLSAQNVLAITHLVSSAVENLAPQSVSVLDMSGNLLSKPRNSRNPDEETSEASIEYRQKLERDILAKVNGTLEPLLGAEKFRAGVNVECDFTSGEQSEETYDPERSVMVTAQRSEDGSAVAAAAGVPGTASNLPRPVARPGSGGSGFARRTENITYQTSRVVKRIKLPQGGIKRVSVSILLDQNVRWEGTGAKAQRVLEPPSPEKVKVIRDLVAGVTGFTAERGDQLIVETLPFEATLSIEPPAATETPAPVATSVLQIPAPLVAILSAPNGAIIVGAGAGVLLVLLVGGVWMLKRKKKKTKLVVAAPAAIEGAAPPATPAEPFEKVLEGRLAEQKAMRDKQAAEALRDLKLPEITTRKLEILVKHVADETKKDPAAAAQVIRSWLSEAETAP